MAINRLAREDAQRITVNIEDFIASKYKNGSDIHDDECGPMYPALKGALEQQYFKASAQR